jgi:hypothetical protein
MDITIKRISLGFALTAFFFMVIGSTITGSTAVTAFTRGFEGAAVFGIIAFIAANILLEEDSSDTDYMNDDQNDQNLDDIL